MAQASISIHYTMIRITPDDNEDGVANDGMITPLGDGEQSAPEAVASVSDKNGDILFYTDGQTVYFKDRTSGDHVSLQIEDPPGATGIGGDPTASQVAIVQVPNTDGVYYIFTTTEVDNGEYALRYSVFDLRNLKIVSSNNLLFTKSTERIAINGGDGSDAVLLVHEYGNDAFRAYPITAEGIGQPVISNVGSVHSFDNPDEAEGYMKFGGDTTGTVVAVAVGDRVEVFNFDTNTLKLSDPVTLDFSSKSAQPYGVEFYQDTLGNTVLLMSTDKGLFTAKIVRPIVEGSSIPIVDPGIPGNFGAIQQGSDGQTYITTPGSSSLGSVSVNANNPSQVTYTKEAVQLPNGATTGLGLPTEVRMGGNSFPEPSISVTEACLGSEVSFSAQGRDDVIETYYWEIIPLSDTTQRLGLSDSLATSQSFTFAIDSAGDYIAQVTLSNPCDQDSVMRQPFTMSNGAEITLPKSANLCQGTLDVSAVDPADDDGTLTFSWVHVGVVDGGNLPAQNTITITEAGRYQVTVTTASGCTSNAEVFVVDSRPDVNLPDDFTLCQGEDRELNVEIASPADPGYAWVVLDSTGSSVATSNEPMIRVSALTPNPGVYNYTVTVTDDSPEGCFKQDTVQVTILGTPQITLTPQNTTDCGNQDGRIDLTFPNGEDPSQLSYSWAASDGSIVGANQNLTGVAGGVYTVTVTNANGCTTQASAAIEDEFGNFLFEATPSPNAGCDDNAGSIAVVIDEASSPSNELYDMSWTLSSRDTLISGTTPTKTFTLDFLPAGTYNLELKSAKGCVQSEANIIIGEPDPLPFDLITPGVVQTCMPTTELEVDYTPTDNWGFTWTNVTPGAAPNKGIVGSRVTYNVRVNESGTYEVRVSDLSGAFCPATRRVRVTIDAPPAIQAVVPDEDNSCETGERDITVEFTNPDDANRDLIYTWSLQGDDGTTVSLPFATQTITATQSGDYIVSVRERGSDATCIADGIATVQVSQPVSVSILYGAVCADGSSTALVANVNTNSSDTVAYAWYNPEDTRIPPSNTRGDSLLITPDMPEGEYRVEVTTGGGCTAEAFASIRRNEVPVITFENDRYVICSEDNDPSISVATITIALQQAGNIVWTYPDGSQLLNTYTAQADQGGFYKVEVTNAYGCTTVDSIEVIDDCQPRIVAPNVFRPGGKNNEFFVYHRYVSDDDFEVQIYNRWGEMVYQSNSPDFHWDGTYKGREAPLGTYPYVIRYKSTTDTDSNGKKYEERGGVTILR